MTTHDSIISFRADRPGRDEAEYRYGDHWRDEMERAWRLAWIPGTREAYLVAVAERRTDRIGDRTVYTGGDTGVVELLGEFSEQELQMRIAGWQEVCGTAGSLEWVRRQLS